MRRVPRAYAGAFFLLLAPAVFGQAWIAPRGQTTISLTLERTEHEGHYLDNGDRLQKGGSHASALALDLDYSVTDRFAITAGIPYVSAKNGPDPSLACLCRTGIDDGNYHSGWQDFRLGARYNIVTDPVVITPLFSLRIPSHHYATAFEAAIGRDLREMQTGVAVGRAFAPGDQIVSLSGQFTYTFVEKLLGVSTNRSNLDVDAGYFPVPALNLHAFVNGQNTRGGVTTDFVLNFANRDLHPELYQLHDGLLRDDYWQGGIGAGYAITDTTNIFASVATTIAGTNSHFGYLYTVGVSRSFGGVSPTNVRR